MCIKHLSSRSFWLPLCWLSLISFGYGQAPPANALVNGKEAIGQVKLTVTVANENGLPAVGMRREHFQLFSNKAEQEIVSFQEQAEPSSIVFILDASGSVDREVVRPAILRGVRDFVSNAPETNEYAVLSFNQQVQTLCDWTRDAKVFSAGLAAYQALPQNGKTALYDAINQGLELAQRRTHPKCVLIVLSDGADNASVKTNLGKLRKFARGQNGLIYGINLQYVYESRPGQYAVTPGGNEQPLTDLAKDTGGWMFISQGQFELQGALERILLQLRAQYTLVFKPTPAALADGQWHPLELKLKLPSASTTPGLRLKVRHNAGFVAVSH